MVLTTLLARLSWVRIQRCNGYSALVQSHQKSNNLGYFTFRKNILYLNFPRSMSFKFAPTPSKFKWQINIGQGFVVRGLEA